MSLLASVYGAGVRMRNALYERGTLQQRTLQGPVVSVGNLSVGGTGKTPFVLLLGQLLKQRGLKFDVLSRGYGRRTKGVAVVDPSGSAADFGDEPLLIARRLEVPVVVGEQRYEAGIAAEAKFGPQLHLLDDGFQHRELARDFDIVLVSPDDARDRLLPAGRLREPLSSLSRADVLVLPRAAPPDLVPQPGKPIWRVRRWITPPPVSSRPIAFCGIGRPQNFFAQLRLVGIGTAAEATYRDHHFYTERDVLDLLALKDRSEGDGFVTTEKDAINLGKYFSALQPLAVIPVQMELLDSANAIDTMLQIVDQKRQRREKIRG